MHERFMNVYIYIYMSNIKHGHVWLTLMNTTLVYVPQENMALSVFSIFYCEGILLSQWFNSLTTGTGQV